MAEKRDPAVVLVEEYIRKSSEAYKRLLKGKRAPKQIRGKKSTRRS
jgi:hypothetical protein